MANFNLVARLMKWIILVDVVLCILLYLPDQIREFYRITITTSLSGGVVLLVWMVVIGTAIGIASVQIAVEAENQLAGNGVTRDLSWLPALLGAAPIFVAGVAQFASIPEMPTASGSMMEVGSIVRIQASELEVNAFRFKVMGGVLIFASIVFWLVAWLVGAWAKPVTAWLNDHYFSDGRTLLVTAIAITSLTVAFVFWPVALPQALNVFGIVAAFAVCLSSFVVHITLLSDRRQIAFIPIILVYSAILAAWGWNDNHTVRSAKLAGDPAVLKDVSDEFIAWLKRPDRLAYAKASKIYPIFVVAAQGGGAYAAYNSATFLARMQDLCPTFRHHLFAISSVSGGSVGAATFAAALDAEDDAGRTVGLEQINSGEPCPQVRNSWQRKRPSKTSVTRAFSNARPTPSCDPIFYRHWSQQRCSPTSRRPSFHGRSMPSIGHARWNMPSRRLAAASCSGDRTERCHPASSRKTTSVTGIPSAHSRHCCSIRPTPRRASASLFLPSS